MTKRALVVGINDYRNWNRTGFANLQFCRADATAYGQMLVDAFGFRADDVTLLEDSEATRQAVLDGIQLMLSRSNYGDVACFYFAGHGDRVSENGLGRPGTRYYETIVPYDGASMISDWELNRIARGLELSRVNFTIVLDSCHSGGLLDLPASARTRTSSWPDSWIQTFQQMCQTVLPFICLPDSEEVDNNVSNITITNNGVMMTADPTKDYTHAARATLFSACNYNESAEEAGCNNHGCFTNAMLECVNNSNFQMSYRDFHLSIRNQVQAATSNRQNPQLRGRQIRLEENFLAGWTYSI